MDPQLNKAGYRLDTQTGVFKKPDFAGIDYSDGDDAENRIEAIIERTSDLSTFSPQLKPHCTDWVSTYHLSGSRSNILRPFELSAEQDILEIGAGCGAITRYLGECGANVLALEGSLRRSKIARSRTRDLSNVTIVCETFSEFKVEQKFDVITLIGVFEYAARYIGSDTPHESMLKSVVQLLKPNGSIILAIENQMGLKYFAGAPEDHLQIPLYGVEDRYAVREPRTFGQESLREMFNGVGLTNLLFLAPYPDYKLPRSIVSETGFEHTGFDASVFAWQSARHDLQLPRSEKLTFAPELAWLPVFKEGLGLALSNSFLVLASNNVATNIDKSVLAYHYSTDRLREYCKETLFKVDHSGQILVTPALLSPTTEYKRSQSLIRGVHPNPQSYVPGKPLSLEFVQFITRHGWAIDEVGLFLKRYISLLERLLLDIGITKTLSNRQDKLPGVFFDVIPQNIIIRSDGEPAIIDAEWELDEDIELGMCIFRSMQLMLAGLTRIGCHVEGREFSRIEFIKEGSLSAGIIIDEIDIHRYVNLEALIQEKLLGKPKENFLEWGPFDLLPSRSLISIIDLAEDNEINHQLAEERLSIAEERLSIIQTIYQSYSWQITEPLRSLRRLPSRIRQFGMDLGENWFVLKLKELMGLGLYLHGFIKQNDGYKALPRKACTLAYREGLSGLKSHLLVAVHDSVISRFDERGQFHRNDYQEWIRRYDSDTKLRRSVIRQQILGMVLRPVISILLPVFDPKPIWLIACIESVKKQLYPDWELCIADDKSTNPEVIEILNRYAKSDSRIKVVFRETNGHISAASNSALDLASGKWVVLLDHDDELSDTALYRIVQVINRNQDVEMIYSDEDKIDETGLRRHPYFKPDWNPDLFYSQNMFSHLGAYKLSLIKEINGFRVGFEGSQDYDLALRCIEKVDANQIHHIPHVLYHWRVHQDSTSLSNQTKPYAQIAAQHALSEHFVKNNVAAEVFVDRSGYRVRYTLPKDSPLVTVIIPVRNRCDLLQQCLDSVFEKTTYQPYEIVVVDNGSDEPELLDYLKRLVSREEVRVIRDDRPFNFSELVNHGVEVARGDVVTLLNNDVVVISADWMTEMVSHATRSDIGAVGARLWYPDGLLQHGGLVLGVGGVAGHSHKKLPKNSPGYFGRADLVSNVSAVTAACLTIRKKLYKEVGGFDEDNLGVAFNDLDFCCRLMELGYRNVWTPYADLYHRESVSRGYDEQRNRGLRFSSEIAYIQNKWDEILKNDPAYSPNLTLVHEDFSYAWPPRVEILGLNK